MVGPKAAGDVTAVQDRDRCGPHKAAVSGWARAMMGFRGCLFLDSNSAVLLPRRAPSAIRRPSGRCVLKSAPVLDVLPNAASTSHETPSAPTACLRLLSANYGCPDGESWSCPTSAKLSGFARANACFLASSAQSTRLLPVCLASPHVTCGPAERVPRATTETSHNKSISPRLRSARFVSSLALPARV